MTRAWSERVGEAAWIAERQPAGTRVCTVPRGYEACARLLHPIRTDVGDDVDGGEAADGTDDAPGGTSSGTSSGAVRWADVAAWSGAPLTGMTPFWRIALPENRPAGPIPGDGNPPSDVLGERDGRALARILSGHTATPDECWFGIWEGYGWMTPGTSVAYLSPGSMQAIYPDDVIPGETASVSAEVDPARPVPAEIHPAAAPGPAPATPPGLTPARLPHEPSHPGPVAELPGRDYLLYAGPVADGLAPDPNERELADLWWPADRAWFVYGDVDLNVTYVAGTAELIAALVASSELEAFAVDPESPEPDWPGELPEWFADRVDSAVADLLDHGRAELVTSRFTASFAVERRSWGGRWLTYELDNESRSSGGESLSREDPERDTRHSVISTIIDALEQ